MFVIARNGRTTVITGWRAWLIGAVAFVASVLVMAIFAFFLLGAAVTAGAIALIMIPAAIIVGLLLSIFGARA